MSSAAAPRIPVPGQTATQAGSHPADSLTSALQPTFQSAEAKGSEALRGAFQDFVGQTFFGEMIKAFRSAQQPSKYFHGGQAEEIFQGQLDQVFAERLSETSAEKIAEPMYELFMLKRPG